MSGHCRDRPWNRGVKLDSSGWRLITSVIACSQNRKTLKNARKVGKHKPSLGARELQRSVAGGGGCGSCVVVTLLVTGSACGCRDRAERPRLVRSRGHARRLRAERPRRASRLRVGRSRSRRHRSTEQLGCRQPAPRPTRRAPSPALRTGARPGGELRLVLELNQAAKPKTFLLAPHEQYGYRLVVDLPPAQAAPVVRRAPQPSTDRGRDVVVVIDAGHGGEDPGASGRGGAREKDVVLAIAGSSQPRSTINPACARCSCATATISSRIASAWRSRTRRTPISSSRFTPTRIATANAKGATVYVLSDKGASDEAALLLAQRENASDLIGGVSLADKDQLLARVLLDLSQSAALNASMAAGQRLIRRMSAVTAMRRREVQQAPFLVLKSPDIPSVLVETAYISNPREEASLRSAKYQSALAAALRKASSTTSQRIRRKAATSRRMCRQRQYQRQRQRRQRRSRLRRCVTSSRAARRCRRSPSAIA